MDQKRGRHLSGRRVESESVTSAGALIYCSTTRRYLFLLRNGHSHDGHWGLAGGKIESGETVVAGLLREIQEEVGQDFASRRIIPVEQFTSNSGKFTFHTFVIPVDQEFVPDLNSEHRGYCWVGIQDYPKPLHPGVWRSINFQIIIDKLKTLESVL